MNVMIKVIQNLRLQKGYNFHDIERATGIPAKRMHSFEKGNSHLSLEELERLFDFLNIKQSDLVLAKTKKPKPRLLMFTALATLLFLSLTIFILYPKLGENSPNSTPDQSQQGTELVDSNAQTDLDGDHALVGPTTKGKGTQLRFWGNVQYQTEQLLDLGGFTSNDVHNDRMAPDYEIVPIEQLSLGDSLPKWLSAKDPSHILLNLATRFIWTDDIEKERDRLNKMGYKNVGIDYLAEVYKPYIFDTTNGKVGVIAYTRTILDAEHIAERNEVGLAKVYDKDLLLSKIEEAKKQVDALIVLIGWGDRETIAPDQKQKELAQQIVAAGADLIVGNHSVHGQEIEWIDGVPVFYSLGHVVSDISETEQETYGYVLDVDLIDHQFLNPQIRIGRLVDGVLTFDLNDQDKEQVKKQLIPQNDNRIQLR